MNAESVKARLKNYAIDNSMTFQEALTYYGLEMEPKLIIFLTIAVL